MLLRQVKANIIHSDDSGSLVEIRLEGQESLRHDVSRGESQTGWRLVPCCIAALSGIDQNDGRQAILQIPSVEDIELVVRLPWNPSSNARQCWTGTLGPAKGRCIRRTTHSSRERMAEIA